MGGGASGDAILEPRDAAGLVSFRLALAAASVAPDLPKEVPSGARSVPDRPRPGILRGFELLVVAGRFPQVSLSFLFGRRNDRSGKAKEDGDGGRGISMATPGIEERTPG